MAIFVFDLDMTLLDTRALKQWRDSGDWDVVMKHLGFVRPFPAEQHAPHKIPALLKAKGHKVAIATSSPRWYAEELINRFGVEIDNLVASGDTLRRKPSPEPIEKALMNLGVPINLTDEYYGDAYYIGDHPDDVVASHKARVTSIGAGWSTNRFKGRFAPDILLRGPELLLSTSELGQRGYLGELLCEGREPRIHSGSILPCNDLPGLSEPGSGRNFKAYALGRYFAKGESRRESSALSRSILDLKDTKHARTLGRALAHFVQAIGWVPDCVVPIPGEPSDRFDIVLGESQRFLPAGVEILPDTVCSREQGGSITFEVSNHLREGAKVLLLDDVLETGMNLTECAGALADSRFRPSEIRIAVFGLLQHRLTSIPERFTKVDVEGQESRKPVYLESSDSCHFIGEYTPPGDFRFSKINDLIRNFKKGMDRQGKPEWRYKGKAIQEIARIFGAALCATFEADSGGALDRMTFVPIPPSKARGDPLHDDRLVQMLRIVPPDQALDVHELIVQTESTEAAHTAGRGERLRPEALRAVYQIDENLAKDPPRQIMVIVDDVLTMGAHFRAAESILSARFPERQVIGLFIARTVWLDD